MKDPAYLEEAKSQKMEVDPMTGEEMETLLKSIYASPPELVQRLKSSSINTASEIDRRGREPDMDDRDQGASALLALSIALVEHRARRPPPTLRTSTAARRCASWSATGPAPATTCMPACSARHLTKHLPGQPVIVIQNMPGAASLTMTNYLYNVAARDGTAIGLPARGLFIEPLFGNENAKFEARKFTWIGSMSRDAALCFSWHTSGIATIDDAKKREVLVGSSGVNGSSHQFPMLVNALIGTKFKPLLGYVDSAGVGLAMERGELEGYCSFTWGSIKSARPKWIEEKQIKILLQLTLTQASGASECSVGDGLWRRTRPSRQAFTLVFADQEMGRPVVAPAGCSGRSRRARCGRPSTQRWRTRNSSPRPPACRSTSIRSMERRWSSVLDPALRHPEGSH